MTEEKDINDNKKAKGSKKTLSLLTKYYYNRDQVYQAFSLLN